MEVQRRESKDFLNDLTNRDQRMMFGVLTAVITADNKCQLNSYTDALFTIGRKRLCQFSTLKYQQFGRAEYRFAIRHTQNRCVKNVDYGKRCRIHALPRAGGV